MATDSINSNSLKKSLIKVIKDVSERNSWTQEETGRNTNIPQGRISRIFKGNTDDISLSKLFEAIYLLGYTIVVNDCDHPDDDVVLSIEVWKTDRL